LAALRCPDTVVTTIVAIVSPFSLVMVMRGK
jgi:hypothetical protein